jgi:hypothetical protein
VVARGGGDFVRLRVTAAVKATLVHLLALARPILSASTGSVA